MTRDTVSIHTGPDLHVAHAVPGRLRMRSPHIRGHSRCARDVARRLNAVPGVTRAKADPVTGSITVHYHHSALESAGFFAEVAAALGLIVAGIEPGEVEELFRFFGAAPSQSPPVWEDGGWRALSRTIAIFALGVLVGRRLR